MDALFYRSVAVENNAIDTETRTVTLSFSSELPVERLNGFEVLSHRNGDYDFSLLNDGAPLLVEHNGQRQVGKVLSAWVQENRGYAQVKFSRSTEGNDVFLDVVDSIRTKVSVGYSATSPTLLRKQEGIPVYSYKWMPREISIVGTPADNTVGIGRSENQIEIQIPQDEAYLLTERNSEMTDKIASVEDVIASIETETRSLETPVITGASIKEIEAVCRHFGLEAEAEGLFNRSATLDEVKTHLQAVREANFKAASQATRAVAAPAVHIKQERTFSKSKAFQAAATGDWDKAGFEREMCQERANNCVRGWDKNVVMLDPNENTRAALTGNAAGTSGFGSNLVGTEYRPEKLIDAVWNKTFLDKVGTDSLLGLQQNQSIPAITSNATSTWAGEVPASMDEQRLTTASKSLTPKQLVSKFAYSRQLLIQGLPNIEEKILGQLFNSIGQALDLAAIANTGVTLSTTGLTNEITNTVVKGTNGGAPTLADFYALRKKLSNAAIDVDKAKFVISNSLNETLHTTLKDSGNTNSGYILAEAQTTLAGLPLVWSQNVPSGVTKGTSTAGTNGGVSTAILGVWDEFLVAQWGSIAVEFDPYSQADNSQMVIRSYSFWDMAIKRLAAFAMCQDFIG